MNHAMEEYTETEDIRPVPAESSPSETEPIERKNRRMVGKVLRVFFLLTALYVSYRFGVYRGDASEGFSAFPVSSSVTVSNADSGSRDVDFALFWKVWDILREKYVDRSELDPEQLVYGAIDGMLSASGDEYTTFFDPEEQKAFDEEISGKFEGIGAEMGVRDGVLTVIAPLEGAPAETAGLRPNDKVLKIDGESSANLSLDESVDRIRGPKGTEVRLTVYHEGEEESREVVVVRGLITVKSLRLTFEDPDIAVLRISRFGEETESEYREAASEMIARGAKGMVIDLRSDPGGLLDAAISIASTMLPKGDTVVIEENAAGERRGIEAFGGDRFSDIPTVVLIDEGSASASEILAGALRENRDNVKLVGRKSFGKGSVQELVPSSTDTSVKVTVARWLTPDGNQIHKVGITPDEDVELTLDDFRNDRDPQMDRALEVLRGMTGS